jgi:hypothetical protein
MMASKRHDEFSAELNRIKKLVPGLDCTEIYCDRGMPLTFVCFLENRNEEKFYMYREEGPQVIASRILECSKGLLARIQKNVDALEEVG